jgi:hypothetical protein
MHHRHLAILLLLLLSGLGACAGGPTGGDGYQWLDRPAPIAASSKFVNVSVRPAGDTASVLRAAIEQELSKRGYEDGPASPGIEVSCQVTYQGSAKSSPAADGGREFAELRNRWDDAGWPSCALFLSIAIGAATPTGIVLWSDSGGDGPVLSRTGHVRRTTTAEGGSDGPADLILDPTIAAGLRAALPGLFPVVDH